MSSTVSVGGIEISSNVESSAAMLETLTPSKESASEPRLLVDEGKPVEHDAEKDEAAKAAALLGKKGGEAAAAKKAEAKEAAKPAETEEAKAKKSGDPRHDPTARVTEATREAKAAREEAARERQERQRIEQELTRERAAKTRTDEPAQPQKAPAADPDPEPQEDAFESYKDFVKAMGRWSARQEHAEIAKRAEAQSKVAAYSEGVHNTIKSFSERMAKAAEADPEFRERTAPLAQFLTPTEFLPDGKRPNQFNAIADELMVSELGPAMMDHFVANQAELQRIASLGSRRDIAREMAKLEARLESAETAPDAATAGTSVDAGWKPGAPPLRPVKGAPHAASPDIYGEIDFDTFASRRRAKG